MFDLTSSKLLILAVVALIVVGPKDLPALLRTLGYYMGIIRRQANEFRSQFEEAMRETELADLKKEVEQLGKDAGDTFRDTTQTLESEMSSVGREFEAAAGEANQSLATQSTQPPELNAPSEPVSQIETSDPGAIEAVAAPVAPIPAQPRSEHREMAATSPAAAPRVSSPAETGA